MKEISKNSKNQYDLYYDFEKENLTNSLITKNYTIRQFGDYLYRINKKYEYLLNENLKILRIGLRLGQIKKDRFEPSFALAHYLKKEQVNKIYELNDEELEKYINGQTLKTNLCDGWTLVTYKNLPISFSKMVKGTLKNFHPKGLRH